MASIRQKPSGKWEARYRDARGQMHARTFGGKMAARRWAAEMESDLRRGEWIDPKLARIHLRRLGGGIPHHDRAPQEGDPRRLRARLANPHPPGVR
jgi:hypothetical protein